LIVLACPAYRYDLNVDSRTDAARLSANNLVKVIVGVSLSHDAKIAGVILNKRKADMNKNNLNNVIRYFGKLFNRDQMKFAVKKWRSASWTT